MSVLKRSIDQEYLENYEKSPLDQVPAKPA